MTTGYLSLYPTPTKAPILQTDSESVPDNESDKNPFYHFYEWVFFVYCCFPQLEEREKAAYYSRALRAG